LIGFILRKGNITEIVLVTLEIFPCIVGISFFSALTLVGGGQCVSLETTTFGPMEKDGGTDLIIGSCQIKNQNIVFQGISSQVFFS
jgi:hypothetical protein